MFSMEDHMFHGPTWDIPPMECGNLGQFFIDEMFKLGDRIYQLDAATGEKWTYAQTARLTIRVVHKMRALGISKGDIVSFAVLNRMSVMPIVYAALCLGATINPVYPDYDEYEYYYLFSVVRPNVIICVERSAEVLQKVTSKMGIEAKMLILERDFEFVEKMNLDGDDVEFRGEVLDVDNIDAFIYSTSGTTGAVKAVPTTQNGFYHGSKVTFLTTPKISETVVLLSYSPLTWTSTMDLNALAVLSGGIRIVANYIPEKHVSVIRNCKVNFMAGHPFYLLEAIKSPEFDEKIAHQIKIATFGGAASTQQQIDSFVKAFPNAVLQQGLGSTEMFITHFTFNGRTELDLITKKRYSVGKLLPYLTGKLIDVETKELITERNKPGELLLKCRFMFRGYYNNEKATKEAIDSDGFFHTGDIFTVDEDDCFYFVSRIKERIIYDHFEVDITKVEDIIAKHPAVESVCLLSKPDQRSYCLPAACIVKKKGFENVTEEEIIHFVEERVEDHERLRGGVHFFDTFPRTVSGKIHKSKLKEILG